MFSSRDRCYNLTEHTFKFKHFLRFSSVVALRAKIVQDEVFLYCFATSSSLFCILWRGKERREGKRKKGCHWNCHRNRSWNNLLMVCILNFFIYFKFFSCKKNTSKETTITYLNYYLFLSFWSAPYNHTTVKVLTFNIQLLKLCLGIKKEIVTSNINQDFFIMIIVLVFSKMDVLKLFQMTKVTVSHHLMSLSPAKVNDWLVMLLRISWHPILRTPFLMPNVWSDVTGEKKLSNLTSNISHSKLSRKQANLTSKLTLKREKPRPLLLKKSVPWFWTKWR